MLANGGMLFVLVPRHRAKEADDAVMEAFGLSGPAPWRLTDGSDVTVTVILWDEGIDALGGVADDAFQGELTQFRSMYRVLNGYDIEPLASPEELVEWRSRESVFVALVDRVTRQLTDTDRLMPMYGSQLASNPEGLEAKGFLCRYMSRPLGDKRPYFSVGVRDFFAGYDTPVWLCFDRSTPLFAVIRERLLSWGFSDERGLVEDRGHVWIPLKVPLHVDGERMVSAVREQVEEVIEVAYAPLL